MNKLQKDTILLIKKLGNIRFVVNLIGDIHWNFYDDDVIIEPASVVLLVASQYALPDYGDRRVWVRGPAWPDHCVRL